MKKTSILLGVLFVTLFSVRAKADAPGPPSSDKLSQGLWWLYQLQYDKARRLFNQHILDDPKNPDGYFYKAATDWWQLAQEFDFSLPDVEKRFEADYQDTVRVARNQLNTSHDPKAKAQACLFWGGAEGLKGRWLVTQKEWVKAYFSGKRGNRLLKKALHYDPVLFDAYLGLGIYDYYTDVLPGIQGILAGLFVHGDKKRGLQELQWAIEKGTRSQVEAMIFQIEIYTSEEKTPEKALPIAHALRQEFPQSPAMHLAEAMILYHMKDWDAVMREAQDFLEKSQKEVPYFTHQGIRPALYCLGTAELEGRHDPDRGMVYMNRILSEGIDSSRWVTFAYLRRGQIYDLKGLRGSAVQDYQMVLSRKNLWGVHAKARRYLKRPYSTSMTR